MSEIYKCQKILAMPGLLLLAVCLLDRFVPIQLHGQEIGMVAPGSLSNGVHTRPGPIPTSLTDVIQQDAFVCSYDFTGSSQTITVQDRQPTPVPLISSAFQFQSSAFNVWPTDQSCRWMPNGISVQASASGVTGYMRIKCLKGPCKILAPFAP